MSIAKHITEVRRAQIRHLFRASIYAGMLLVFILSGAFIIAYEVLVPPSSKVALEEGKATPSDVVAPRSLKYESEVLSDAKRDAAVAAVRPVYDPPDPAILSQQLQLARQILDYIENVRYDDFATPSQKTSDINAIMALTLDPTVTAALLSIDADSTWRAIDAQVTRLLERVMSGEVRDDNIQAKRDNLPNLISASYSETEVKIITGIVSDLVSVNTFFNEELTRQAQVDVAENVPVEVRTFIKGQMIIREGEIATAADIEALERFGLLRVTERRTDQFFGGLLAMVMVTLLSGFYIRQFYPKIYYDRGFVVLLGILFLIFLAGTQIVDPNSRTQPYFYPAPALAFLVATLIGPQLAIVVAVMLAGLAGFMTGNSLEFTILIAFSGPLGVLSLGRTERLNAYFVASGVVTLASAAIAIMFALGADDSRDLFTVFLQLVGSIVNGLFSAAVALAGLYLISGVMNIPTSLKIVELLQPNHPLLQRLLREAPGTYQHSLQVANLAEQGAQQIDANTALLRVAAMYHDVGKILNPHFFSENQADGINPHDALDDPWQSARIIIGHVSEGDRLARRYRLPNRIRDFVLEHHGSTQVFVFFQNALKRSTQDGQDVDIKDFTYPGPRPQSRETAILMLADGCESSVRARRPQSKEDIRETVDYIFEQRLQTGQLDDSGLTLNDLRVLRDTFLTALQGIFHPRIAYPGTPGHGESSLPAKAVATLTAGEETGTTDEKAPERHGSDSEQPAEDAGGPVAEETTEDTSPAMPVEPVEQDSVSASEDSDSPDDSVS
jgi:putative nucleotidyltransferase with HDIG domain